MNGFSGLEDQEIIALVALIVSAMALVANIIQSHVLLKHNKLTVRPLLSVLLDAQYGVLGVDNVLRNLLHVQIQNSGNGPAVFKDCAVVYRKIYYRDHAMINMVHETLSSATVDVDGYVLRPNFSLPQGEKIDFLSVPFQDATHLEELQERLSEDYDLRIVYESIVQQAFFYSSVENHNWFYEVIKKNGSVFDLLRFFREAHR